MHACHLLTSSECNVRDVKLVFIYLCYFYLFIYFIFSFSIVRFDKRRLEEDVEVARRKLSRREAEADGLTVVKDLRQQLREYREILKCSICHDRPKEVVIIVIE